MVAATVHHKTHRSSNSPLTRPKETDMIRHVFAWRIAAGQNHQEILDLLNTLPEKLPIIKYWEIGVHQGDPGDNGAPWDGVLISDFESWDALDEYSNDPYHVSVVEDLTPRFEARAVVDFERTDA